MSALNFNVSGAHGADAPSLESDSGFVTSGVFPSPNRFVVVVPAGVTGGATLHYQQRTKHVRVIVPPGDGQWEAGAPPCQPPDDPPVLMAYTSALPRLQPDGTRFKGYVWAMMTGFCDYKLFLDGGPDALRPVLAQARDLGANGRRVLGMMAYITGFDPRAYGQRFYDALPSYVALNAEYGQRVHFDVFADNQVLKLGTEHWQRMCDALRPLESVVIGAGNEWPKNGFDPFALSHPGVISSQGSALSDAAPPMPGWGIWMWHGRRDYPKVFMSADDMTYVSRGLDSDGHQYAPEAPTVHDEPMGFAEVPTPGRRSTDPILAEALMLTGRAYGAGATFHSEDGIYSRLLGPVQQTCARAFFDAQG